MVNFHTIGDSHASEITWGKVKVPGLNIICHHLGPMTCASFGMTRPILVIDDDEWICFCFGEIDCRDHIGKDKEHYKEVIDKIVDNYFYAIKQYKGKKLVLSVVPANVQTSAAGDPWPCVGTDEERKEYVRYFNQRLREHCCFGVTFLDVHDKYADENGFLNVKYRDAGTHITDPVFINECLCGLL